MIVEFEPAGEAATGWSRDALLQEGEAFSAPDSSGKLEALKVWEFDDALLELARDASEMTVGPDERLYILSQESAVLIRLERSLKPDEDKVRASAHWRLPQELETAEGLVIDHEMHPWVTTAFRGRSGFSPTSEAGVRLERYLHGAAFPIFSCERIQLTGDDHEP